MIRAVLLALCLALASCAAKEAAPPPDCQALYVILPGNFIIDLAAGAEVFINPAAQEFALFCAPQDASEALKRANPAGDWRVYKLHGSFDEIGQVKKDGSLALAKPALVTDWVDTK